MLYLSLSLTFIILQFTQDECVYTVHNSAISVNLTDLFSFLLMCLVQRVLSIAQYRHHVVLYDCNTGTQCKESEFFCYDRQFCINATQHCDGFYDCKDFSDEQNCIG